MDSKHTLTSSRVVIQMLITVVLIPLLPLVISARWDWWEAWALAIVLILGFAASRLLAARRRPVLLTERARFVQHHDPEPWDRLLAPLVGPGSALILIIAGLDARFAWSLPPSTPIKVAALVVLVAGLSLGSWALMENRFFSGIVRIQSDRDQKVVSTGPYRWIRHPGYSGALLTYFAAPALLGSIWAFVPALFLAVALIIRTSQEDLTLRRRLEGYAQYAQKVRYRLVPFVW